MEPNEIRLIALVNLLTDAARYKRGGWMPKWTP